MTSFSKRDWRERRPTKTFVFWLTVAAVVVTLIVGFTWGGWVTSGTAQATAKTLAADAVVHRLTAICVAVAGRDPAKDKKLKEMKGSSIWERADFVKKQGWATMPGDTEADGKVAEECAMQLLASAK